MTLFAHEVWRDQQATRQWIHSANPTVLVETHDGKSRVTLVGDRGVVAARLMVATTDVKKLIFTIYETFDFAAPGRTFATVSVGPSKGGGSPPVPQPPVPGGMPPDPAVFLTNLELHAHVQMLATTISAAPASDGGGFGLDAQRIGITF